MLLFADQRRFTSSEERFGRCLFCGKEIVVLPDDRRRGSCFDCLALAVPGPSPCPSCGATISGEERGLGCPECRWYPGRE